MVHMGNVKNYLLVIRKKCQVMLNWNEGNAKTEFSPP